MRAALGTSQRVVEVREVREGEVIVGLQEAVAGGGRMWWVPASCVTPEPHQGPITPRTAGAVFELQLRLDSGKQVLSDKALRRAISGDVHEPTRAQSREDSRHSNGRTPASRRTWPRSTLVQNVLQERCNSASSTERFGADAAERPEEFADAQCGICFSDAETLMDNTCKRYCSNPACRGTYCGDCFGQYVSGKIRDALHFAPPIGCPGCKTRVRTSVWAGYVPTQVRAQYQANAAALLSARCPACDKACSLLAAVDPDAGSSKAEEALREACGLGPEVKLSEIWYRYANGETSADSVLETLLKTPPRLAAEMVQSDRLRLSKLVEHAASLVADEERRVTLQLAWLRHCPKIYTPCCSAKLCFKCKVQGWHPRLTCEQQQRRFIGSEAGVQPCPQCGVPTQRTEGCNQVQCVCGRSWEWDDTAHGLPLILACSMVPHAGGKEAFKGLLRELLSRGAGVDASDPEDGSRLASCLVCNTSSITHERFEPSDALRLTAALEVVRERGEGEAIDLDFVDNDGDTPLSVAIGSGNIDAVRALVATSATLGPRHMENLRGAGVDVAVMQSIARELQPLAMDTGRWRQGVDALEVFLQLGVAGQARARLEQPGELEVGQLHADAFMSGSLTSEAAAALNDTLRQKAAQGDMDWHALCAASATDLLRAELSGGWPLRGSDPTTLGNLISARANVRSEEDGKPILNEALEREDAAAVAALLSAGAAADDSWHERTLQLLSRQRSGAVIQVLSRYLATAPTLPPLWMCVEFGLGREVSLHLQNLARTVNDFLGEADEVLLDERLVVACVKRQLLAGPGDAVLLEVEAAMQPHLESVGKNLVAKKKEAASALLLMEMKCCFNFERDPDVETMRALLEAGADPNATAGSLQSEVFRRCARICDNLVEESEHRLPLFTLAVNTYCSPQGAEAATKLLVQYSADLDLVDEDGDTALAVTFMKENITVAEALIRAGADVASAADAWDAYQAWEHPAHLKRLASISAGKPMLAWTPKQRLLLGAAGAEDVPELLGVFEDCEEASRSLLLARGHLDAHQPGLASLEAALRETWGEEEFTQATSRAATTALRAEVSGALEGMWRLDCRFAVQLLRAGADADARVVLPSAEDDEDEEEEEEEEDDGEFGEEGEEEDEEDAYFEEAIEYTRSLQQSQPVAAPERKPSQRSWLDPE